MNKYDIYKAALDKWGVDLQITMMVEECAELIKAVTKFKRNPNESAGIDVLHELADVQIMVEQMRFIFADYGDPESFVLKKLERLANRVKN